MMKRLGARAQPSMAGNAGSRVFPRVPLALFGRNYEDLDCLTGARWTRPGTTLLMREPRSLLGSLSCGWHSRCFAPGTMTVRTLGFALSSILFIACANPTDGGDVVGSESSEVRSSVQGRFISVAADENILVEGDEICFLLIEPTVGKFVAFYDASRAACFHDGLTSSRDIDLGLRGKIIRARTKTITDPS